MNIKLYIDFMVYIFGINYANMYNLTIHIVDPLLASRVIAPQILSPTKLVKSYGFPILLGNSLTHPNYF